MMRDPEHLNKHLRFRDCLRPHVFFGFCHINLISCVDVPSLLDLGWKFSHFKKERFI